MDMAFLKVLNMSISASWLVLVVLALRFALKKSPRWIHVCLWALVAVRLVCPFSIESVLSLIPSTETVPEEIFYIEGEALHQNVYLDVAQDGSAYEPVSVKLDASVDHVTLRYMYATFGWLGGMGLMTLYALYSYFRLKRKVSASIDLGSGVYLCDYIDTPFILGIIRPRIYLPSAMEPEAASHVLAHERSHISRKDHWWKPLGYVLLTVHWFNPLMWLAYILLCQDIELACDEKVVRQMALPQRKSYSDALLKCSVKRMHVAACPLAFGEVGVKERVKTVLNYKKPAFWLVLVAVSALIGTAVCFLTDPVEEQEGIFGRSYRVEKVVYRNPVLSYYMTEADAPLFKLTEDQSMHRKTDNVDWENLGAVSKTELSAESFDNLFFGQDLGMEDGVTLAQLREDNREAWLLSVPNSDNENSVAFYLLLWQHSGDVYLAQGIAMNKVYPLHETALDSTCSINWLFRLTPSTSDSPYRWTSTVESWDIQKGWANPYGQASYTNTIEGSRLDELLLLLNEVKENEIVARNPSGANDPLWNLDGTVVYLYCVDDMPVWLRYVDNTVIISTVTDSGVWETDGYWVIENDALTGWMQNLAYGGTYMLSDENRDEIRRLVQQEHVQFFNPQEYGDLLFVGCAYDNGRGLGVACYEKLAHGFKLLRLIRDEDVKRCASGSELYYCDYEDLRIFLILNESVTGMEWAGAHENSVTIDTHPGLMVEYFPEALDAMYRFCYGGGTTMYMDWNNKIHGQPPEYDVANFDDPDDAYRVCSNLRFSQVDFVWATEILEVDDRYSQAYTYDLTNAQIVELLNLLHTLPEDAYEQAEVPEMDVRFVDIFLTNEAGVYPMLRLKLDQGTVYYQILLDAENNSQGWKINAPELLAFLESFYDGDLSTWHRFAPFVKSEGEVIWSVDGVEITVPKAVCFEYDVSKEGIRFKPEGQEGWVLIQYRTEPFGVCGTGLRTLSGKYAEKETVQGYYDGNEAWSFIDITVPSGDMVFLVLLLNEEAAPWVAEYEDEISWIIMELEVGLEASKD